MAHSLSEDGPGLQLLRSLQDHERQGVPVGAGTDTAKGFDMVGKWGTGHGGQHRAGIIPQG